MAGRRKIYSRMEKHIEELYPLNFAPGGESVSAWQLENGEEECQVKRIVLSATAATDAIQIKLGLFQKQPTTYGDFTDDTVIYSLMLRNQMLVNETTTVRVPQGWFLAVGIHNPISSVNQEIAFNCQINYLSLG